MQVGYENLSDERFISSYGKNYIVIQKKKYFENLVILNNKIYENIDASELFSHNLIKQKIEDSNNNYDFILFGTGVGIKKLSDKTMDLLVTINIGYEIMNSLSAFKTYNILLSQKRNILGFFKLET